MPKPKSSQPSNKRQNSYNAPKKGSNNKKRTGLASGGKKRNAQKNAKNNASNNARVQHGKYTKMMVRDVQIREQPFEYCVILHTECALPCPSKAVENNNNNNESSTSTTLIFDSKQIVSLGICIVHTPSGTVCGRLQAYVLPPPNSPPLTDYCCNVLNVSQEDVDNGLPLVDILENAERWIKKIIRGEQEEDPDTVYEIKRPAAPGNNNKNAKKKEALSKAKSENKDGDDDSDSEHEDGEDSDDEEGEENEDEEEEQEEASSSSSDEEEEIDNNNDDNNKDSSVHKIMLAADGIPTIASIFQGNQQYMDSILRPEINNQNDNSNNDNDNNNKDSSSNKKRFSYLNTLSDTIFSRWVDIRESFHRYFRVNPKRRLKLNEMLKEIGLSYQGRGKNSADMSFNAARLMVACMKKGCVYSYLLECRTSHEQDITRGMHIGNISTGGDGGSAVHAADADTLGVLGEWKKQINQGNSISDPKKNFRTTSGQISSLVAGEGGSMDLPLPASKQQQQQGGRIDLLYGKMINEVLIRWILFIVFLGGGVWNAVYY